MDITAALFSYLSYYLAGGFLYSRSFDLRDIALSRHNPVILFVLSVVVALFAAFSGGGVWAVGPIFFLILSSVFVKNFDRMIKKCFCDFENRVAEIEKNIFLEKEKLEKSRADLNVKSRRLEKITADFSAASQTLVCIDIKELSESITRTILGYPGVLSAAVFDFQKNCLSFSSSDASDARLENIRRTADDYFRSSDDKNFTQRISAEGNLLVYPFVSASNLSHGATDISGLCVVEVEKNNGMRTDIDGNEVYDVRNFLVEDVLSVFSLGFSRAVLFKKYEIKSRHDSLTGLFNRRYFMEKLQVEIHRAKRYGGGFGVLMLDIDHFKNINDTCGHPAGDEALVQLSEILSKEMSPLYPGIFWGRYGGEEFIGCIPFVSDGEKNTDANKFFLLISRIAENLKSNVEKKIIVSDASGDREIKFSLTVSVGVAVYPDDGDTADKIITAADSALYDAKISGRNRVVFHNKKYFA